MKVQNDVWKYHQDNVRFRQWLVWTDTFVFLYIKQQVYRTGHTFWLGEFRTFLTRLDSFQRQVFGPRQILSKIYVGKQTHTGLKKNK